VLGFRLGGLKDVIVTWMSQILGVFQILELKLNKYLSLLKVEKVIKKFGIYYYSSKS